MYAALAASAIAAGISIWQAIEASKIDPKRPTYKPPAELGEEVARSKQELYGRAPGVAYAKDRLNENYATGTYSLQRSAGSSGQLLSGLSQLQMQRNAAERGLLAAEQGDYFRRLQNYKMSLSAMARARDKAFDINEWQKFQDDSRAKAALTQSAITNFTNSANTAAGAFGSYGGGQANAGMGDYINY